MYAIEIDRLTKYYGKQRGVANISFQVETGDIFGFLGPNGSGKSTTIRSMLGLIHFQSGSIRIFGKDVTTQKEEILREIGYMPSEAMFYPQMKGKDVMKLAADLHKKDCTQEAQKLCERFQVNPEKKISDLSLGNRKKISIVCAMQHKPKLFLFDEPTSGLDPLMQAEFFRLIKEYVTAGATCMLSTHVLSEVKQYCQHAVVMKNGQLLCTASVADLTKTNAKRISVTRNQKQESFLFQGNINDLLQDLASSEITDILIEEPSLDETFMHFYQS